MYLFYLNQNSGVSKISYFWYFSVQYSLFLLTHGNVYAYFNVACILYDGVLPGVVYTSKR